MTPTWAVENVRLTSLAGRPTLRQAKLAGQLQISNDCSGNDSLQI
eukprot:CAMPEP_0185803066 /NCGR_PEP_ID=MMETSP1322-20130828/2388_1 /TAXON_ID=265543 /ORGANISM="Minutocellus polymorphus, Strain RCC2270" /LENGTH=44 /DNA_ID= /DNA_START= /DNA_END= /DNA_ORIENTATION=